MMPRFAIAIALIGAPWLHDGAGAAEVTERLTRTLTLGAGGAIEVDATIAELTITGSNRPDVAVEIVRHAPTAADFAAFPALVTAVDRGVRVSVVQHGDGRDARFRSEIVIRAPASAPFPRVRVFEGRVRVTGLTAATDVLLQRGPIVASALAGRVRLESGVGSVEVSDSTLTPGGMMRLRVFNGPLRVHFARAPIAARVLAVTLNGTITSDIPLAMKDQFGPRFGETTIGSGDPVMSLDVVKGDIAISVQRP